MVKARVIIYVHKCSWHERGAIEIAHPRERRMANVVYNNVNCNASVLCPYFLFIFVQCELRFHNDCTIKKKAIHTEKTVSG